MGRKKQRVRYELDSGEIKSLTKDEIKAILRGADELVATGKIYPGQTPSGRFWRLARRNLPSNLLQPDNGRVRSRYEISFKLDGKQEYRPFVGLNKKQRGRFPK